MSVLDNLRLAVQAHEGNNFKIIGVRDHEPELNEKAKALGAQVGLEGDAVLNNMAGSLPHGAQRQLDIALALAAFCLSNTTWTLFSNWPTAFQYWFTERSSRRAPLNKFVTIRRFKRFI